MLKWAPSPLWLFSTFGEMGIMATTAYKQLASLLAAQDYGSVVSWIRYSTSFSLLRSAAYTEQGLIVAVL